MDYEKKYKEALERAEGVIEQNPLMEYLKKGIEYIFPELKESEDEMIRKTLIELVKCNERSGYTLLNNVPTSSMLAWLEKQGEQKPTNKVEPKFHEDEWITNGDYTWKIVEVKPLDYILQSQDGNIVDDTISHVDEQFHSFTIEDAKDGDVLVSQYNKPFIYNGNLDSFRIGSYCGISTEGRFNVATEKCCWTGNRNIYLATKEQRDLLFQKMHEAGYMWDSESKQLLSLETEPNVEQNPAWSEEDEERLKSCLNILQPKSMMGVVETINTKWLKSLKQRIGE